MKKYGIPGGLAAIALLAACGGGTEGGGGVTAEESQQLNEAAEMLDASNETFVPADETGLANGGAPAETGGLVVADEAATNGQ